MSKWSEWKESLGETRPWDLIDPSKHVEDENLGRERFEICKSCPQLIELTGNCKKCGCFMALKTKLQAAVCPIGKW
jgi:hypothetical protein